MPKQVIALPSHSTFSAAADDAVGVASSLRPEDINNILKADNKIDAFEALPNPVPIEAFDQFLVNAALFGDPLILTDGWLLVTEGWWASFFEPENHPLLSLLRSGFLIIFSRTKHKGCLSELAQEMAERDLAPYRRIQSNARFPILRKLLEHHDNGSDFLYTPWPKWDMDHSSEVEILSLVNRPTGRLETGTTISEANWEKLIEAFLARMARKQPARQAWARSVVEHIAEMNLNDRDVRNLLTVGNKAWHHSRALTLQADAQRPIAVQTIPSIVFEESYRQAPTIDPQAIYDPLLEFRVKASDIRDFSVLEELTTAKTNLGSLKIQYQFAKKQALNPDEKQAVIPYHERYKEYYEVTVQYAKALNAKLKTEVYFPYSPNRWYMNLLQKAGEKATDQVVSAMFAQMPIVEFGVGVAGSVAFGMAFEVVKGRMQTLLDRRYQVDPVQVRDVYDRAKLSKIYRQSDPTQRGLPVIGSNWIDESYAAAHTQQLRVFN